MYIVSIDPSHWALLLLMLTMVACAVKPVAPPAAPVLVPTQACDHQCVEGFKKATVQILEDLRVIRNVMLYQLQMMNPEGVGIQSREEPRVRSD
jgi:hypothetical protein